MFIVDPELHIGSSQQVHTSVDYTDFFSYNATASSLSTHRC